MVDFTGLNSGTVSPHHRTAQRRRVARGVHVRRPCPPRRSLRATRRERSLDVRLFTRRCRLSSSWPVLGRIRPAPRHASPAAYPHPARRRLQGVAAVVVVTVAALPWCDGGVEHRRRDRGHGHTPRPRHAHEPPSPAPATLGPAAAAEQSRRPAMAAAADGGGGGRQRRPAAVVAMAVGGGPVRTALPAALLRSCHAASEASSPHGRPWVRHAAAQSSGVTRRASHVLHGRRGVY